MSERGRRPLVVAGLFLLPAAVLLGALVAYPILFTVVRSTYNRAGTTFVGLANYRSITTSGRTLVALRNNAVWVVVAPTVVTALGLVFAVAGERVRWQAAFKFAVFMPMAISFLAAGVIFRLAYERDPDRGLVNAALRTARSPFASEPPYPGAHVRDEPSRSEGARAAPVVLFPVVGFPAASLPSGAAAAVVPQPETGRVVVLVWLDFRPGGGGTAGAVDAGERALQRVTVRARTSDGRALSASTDNRGVASFPAAAGVRSVVLDAVAFAPGYRGPAWLGPSLVTPSVIGAYVWIWTGFAMVVIGAGLAALPREVLEAARVDGASELQVFRRVTMPLLQPVLLVVLVTLVINVLKVFDLVLVIPPGSVQANANVIALEMWRVSFGGARDQGLGSALAVVLFLLVVPAMAFNVRRFRSESR